MIDRIGRLVAVAAVVLVLAFGWWADQQASDADDRAASEEIAREALAAQVEQLGAEPVVPPGEDTEPGDVIVVPGEPGSQGVQGPPGSPGRNGEDGSACVPTNPACIGPTGPQGDIGAAGESGIGTQGEPGPTGPQGEPGPQGPQGEPGTSFTSFTFTDGPRTFRCTDPDGDHEFMCEQIEPPPVVTLP